MKTYQRIALVPAAVIGAIAIAACSASSSSPSATAPAAAASVSPGAATVAVKLQEWAVTPAVTTAAAGPINFKVTNTGPEDVHEFVVLKTDTDPNALPAETDGSVSESGAGTVIGEIEDIPVGQTQDLQVSLVPGKYVLLCNIYDETEKEAHYKMGMRTTFEVTP